MKTSILVVDDESRQRQSLALRLERMGFQVANAASGKEAVTLLELRRVDFALVDLRMPEMDGIELLRRIHARWPEITVIMMTAYSDVSTAIEAIKAGAFHYLAKPIKEDELLEAISKATPERRKDPFHGVSGESATMRDVIARARHAATHDKPVLVTGEIGTGKESLATAIHAGSGRARNPFVPVRCAIGRDELEAEIFGRAGNPGRLIEANGGTVLLDRVECLPLRAQERLLRVLQDGEVLREGDARPARADVRVIATAASDLDPVAASGAFRDDLRLMLNASHIHLPPLRERPADIPALARALAEKYAPKGSPRPRFERDAIAALQAQPWPGNIVELEGLIEHALAIAGPESITMEVLRKTGVEEAPGASPDNTGLHPLKEDLEREEGKLIEDSLVRNNHNLRLVAIDLGISRTSLWRKMKRYGLEGH